MILGGIFDLEEKKNRIKELEEEQTKENFWQTKLIRNYQT